MVTFNALNHMMNAIPGRIQRVPVGLAARTMNSKSGTSGSFSINVPLPTTHSWERSAKLVKQTDTSNQYLEHIRDLHDPSMQLKTMEDELKGTMGKALGKQGDKVLNHLKKVHEQKQKYEMMMKESLILCSTSEDGEVKHASDDMNAHDVSKLSETTKMEIVTTIQDHNRFREDAIQARWKLLVHRQAVGFITQNHRFVHEKFPIPEKLDMPNGIGEYAIDGNCKTKTAARNIEPVKRNFGDQLDWWERIGRWK